MAEQMRPASKELAPDPANAYERANPENEAGMGRLDNNKAVPARAPDHVEDAVKNKQDLRQLNAQDVGDARRGRSLEMPAPVQPDHSMNEEEPMGWDQAPEDIHNPRDQRQPKTGGVGGTP